MIKTWKHKGLKNFYQTGSKAGIIPKHARRLKIILQMLDAADSPERLDVPGMSFHQLKGDKRYYYAVTVRANWRVIFQFDGINATLVDYLDYH